MILVVDNYDSFTYNLVHLVAGETDDVRVVRNDAISLDAVRALAPDGILISPGPGRPDEAGVSARRSSATSARRRPSSASASVTRPSARSSAAAWSTRRR